MHKCYSCLPVFRALSRSLSGGSRISPPLRSSRVRYSTPSADRLYREPKRILAAAVKDCKMTQRTPDDAFPEAALLPKQETGVTSFLQKNPLFDGRGVVIAIFDTGVDPRAAGLQVTSDGKPKVIQMLDGSGAGDVDMKTKVESSGGIITGLSGRKLKIPSSWVNPSGKYRIGIKPVFDLYPGDLKTRIKATYKEKNWTNQMQPALVKASKQLQDFEATHTGELKPEESALKEELEARVEILSKLDKNYADLGPFFDCILWHDGSSWKAVIDTTCGKSLEECEVVGPYSETLKCSSLTKEDNLSYCINVYDDGDILEIVTISGSHGTHVASIASANIPDNPSRNGIAPGAQIVSISLGDGRVGTMETGTSMYRACAAVMKLNVDVINMSYGESSKWCKGRVWEHFEEIINRKNIVMCVSAGNCGPALSSLGTPPTQNAIGVGAIVTPPMMEAEYSLRDKIPTIGHNWTSRGPGIDARLGVSICAPGAAITSVPLYTLQGSQLMNGTSMAAPNAAGVACLLVSALRQSAVPHSPYMVKRSLENTALKLPSYEPFANGQGLIQVEKAWEWLEANRDANENLLRFEIKSNNGSGRGVYLREPYETDSPQIKTITIQPVFLDEKNVEHKLKTSYDQNFSLSCDASWVQSPTCLNMMYQERGISIKVDPTQLPDGSVSFTEILAHESGKSGKGPVFRIPITVIKPKKLPAGTFIHEESMTLKPGVPNRCFLAVPAGATWCLLKIKSHEVSAASHVNVHTIQFEQDSAHVDNTFAKMFQIQPMGEVSYPIKVLSDRTIEFCLSKWWNSFGDMGLSWSVQFFGLRPNSQSFHLGSGDGYERIDVSASLGPEEVQPQMSLKHHVMVLRPSKSVIVPGGARDIIADGRNVHANNLTYSFSLAKGGEVYMGLPMLYNYLYESEYNSQLWMLYDQNKQLLKCGDAWPTRYSTKLEKGDYTVIAQVRHEDRALLEKTADLALHVVVKLSSPINLDVYSHADQALIQGKKAIAVTLPAKRDKAYYIGHVPSDKIPKGASSGHFLKGTMTFTTDELGKKVATFPIRYFLNDASNGNGKKKGDKSEKDKDKKNLDEKFEESTSEICAQLMAKGSEKAAEACEQLLAKNPALYQLKIAKIELLMKKEKMDQQEDLNRQVIALANSVLEDIGVEKLLASLGSRQDKSDQAATKQLEKQKQCVLDALCKKGEALCNLKNLGQNVTSSSEGEVHSQLTEVYKELQRWVDPLQEVKTAPFVEKYLGVTEQFGKLVKLLMKIQEEKPTVEVEQRLIQAYKKLDWDHCADLSERCLLVKYPSDYRSI